MDSSFESKKKLLEWFLTWSNSCFQKIETTIDLTKYYSTLLNQETTPQGRLQIPTPSLQIHTYLSFCMVYVNQFCSPQSLAKKRHLQSCFNCVLSVGSQAFSRSGILLLFVLIMCSECWVLLLWALSRSAIPLLFGPFVHDFPVHDLPVWRFTDFPQMLDSRENFESLKDFKTLNL